MKLSVLAHDLGADLAGPPDLEITGIAGIGDAREGEITFLADAGHLQELDGCRASAVIVPRDAPAIALPALKAGNPRLAFAQAIRMFHVPPSVPGGISDRAVLGAGATIGADPAIGAFVTVGDGARLGDRVTLHPGVFIGAGSVIGNDVVIHANVSVREGVTIGSRVIIHSGAVLGSDGFGFVTDRGIHHKIPQVGGVVIEDDVEIGANCAIDRATLGATVIKRGTKLDNLVHIAHNVTVGEHCLLTGQVGIAGSTTLGSYVVIGGQSAVTDHVTIGDRVMVGGGSGVTKDIGAGQVVAGYPAMPVREWLKAQAVLQKLPELRKLVAQLQRRIEELEKGT